MSRGPSLNEVWREREQALKRETSDAEHLRYRGYDPNQPRVPKGHPDGGQWTEAGSGESGREIASDVTPDNQWMPGNRYAQNAGPRFVPIRVGGQLFYMEGGQAGRLATAQARAHDAINRVRQVDREWKPRPSARYETVEGLIRTFEAEAVQAEARIAELASCGIGPGPFATRSIPARGPERNFRVPERAAINEIGVCHTCGTTDPGTRSGNFIPDHQMPNALNPPGRAQRLFPHCLSCSLRQGGWISNRGSKR